MEITKEKNESTLTLALKGRLDTVTAPQLEEVLSDGLEGISSLIFDFSELSYISSAGLRIILASRKRMSRQGSMVIRNVCDEIKEVFDLTGFSDILTIE